MYSEFPNVFIIQGEIMKLKNYKPRIIEQKLSEYLDVFGAVCIEGPKWCGKTWTSSKHSESEIFIGDPSGNFQNRKIAEMSPSLILEGQPPRLIDEWQEVPALWDAIRHTVDQSGEKGQYILTGSATPNHKGILHSGAGRIGKLRMHPMSLFESGDSKGLVSLEALCKREIRPAMTREVDLKKIAAFIVRGGWPGNLQTTEKNISLLPTSYLKAIVDDDVHRLDGIKRDSSKMQLLLKSLARNESTIATNKTLKNDIKAIDDEDITVETIAAYLDVLKRLFVVDNLPPFSPQIRSTIRVKQSEKRHFCDPSLACALLRATPEKLIGDLESFGFLFESLCLRDLRIYAQSFEGELYHYQDYNGNEIDAVIELPSGQWCAFEIKLGANQIDDAAANLIKISRAIESKNGTPPTVLCVICGLSNAAYMREDGVFIVPITALKN